MLKSNLAWWSVGSRVSETSKQLQSYQDKFKQRGNATVTMMPIRQPHAQLRVILQEPAGGGS